MWALQHHVLVMRASLLLIGIIHHIDCLCYFPAEFQGAYLIQTQASPAFGGHTVSYSEITVEADAIPPWGRCHRRRGNNVILKDSTGGEDCMRCFHLTLKTPNVIQIHSEGLARCYTNEEAARATCPDDRAVAERKFKEIMLYRKQQQAGGGLNGIESIFCPINGRFRFTYTANGGGFRCDQPTSEASNCPHGNGMSVKFKKCNFPDLDVSFQCLGDWPAVGEDRYLALMDLREEPESRPKYRCGMYRLDDETGRVYVSLSADSTCFNQLSSATDGYESLLLTPYPRQSLPQQVENSRCRFPDWTQGYWPAIQIEGNRFIYNEKPSFQTIGGHCLSRENNTPAERFSIYTVTQCGEERYHCLWLNKKSDNVFEFQLGLQSSAQLTDSLCHDEQFHPSAWITQGRAASVPTAPSQSTSCPITGDYTGEVPGASGLCAKVASDCNNPDVMFYTVSSCDNRTHVFEGVADGGRKTASRGIARGYAYARGSVTYLHRMGRYLTPDQREYRCLGNWEEDGILYTYTQRKDMPGYQCFSGKVFRNGEEAFIKEAGESCSRGEDPFVYGMKIAKQASCPQISPVTFVPVRPPWRPPPPPPPSVQHIPPSGPKAATPPHDTFYYQNEADSPTTKPWKPITGRPQQEAVPASSPSLTSSLAVILIAALSASIFCC